MIKSYLQDAPPATVSADAASLTFQVADGVVADPVQQKVGLTTPSTTPLSYTVQANRPWIKTASTGTVSAASPASLTVTVDPSSFTTAGSYTGSLTVTLATGGSVAVAITAVSNVTRSKVSVSITPNPVYQAADSSGAVWVFTVTVQENAGVGTRLTAFKIDASDLTSGIFSSISPNLAASSSFSESILSHNQTVPSTHTVELDGVDDATGYSWKQTATVEFQGTAKQAVLNLASNPDPVRENDAAPANCTWKQQIILTETAGFGVQLTRFVAGSYDLTSSIASIFGTTNFGARQAIRTFLCWSNLTPPTTTNLELDGTDSGGNAIVARATANFFGPLPNAATLRLLPGVVSVGADSSSTAAFTVPVTLDLGGSNANWVASTNAVSWLTGAPASGAGNGTLTLTVNPSGLPNGTYASAVVVQSANTTPQIQSIPVYLQVGPPPPAPSIADGGFANGASFQTSIAPGSLISIFGSNLTTRGGSATTVPLPVYGNSTSVTINGYAAPLKDVFPTQLNVQVPWEVQPGTAQVTVNVDGKTDTKPMQVAPIAPGIFVDASTNRLVPVSTGKRGDAMILFITGQGAVSPAVPTGAGPLAGTALSQLPAPVAPVAVTVGGVQAQVLFAGIPTGLVGVTQINFLVPATAPAGDQPLVVTVGDQKSKAATVTVQ